MANLRFPFLLAAALLASSPAIAESQTPMVTAGVAASCRATPDDFANAAPLEAERVNVTLEAQTSQLYRFGARSQDAVVSGSVVITAPELFGRLNVMPIVESFLVAYPQTGVRTLFLNRMVDLVGEGVDVAVRLATLPDSSLTAIKLGEVRRLTCAAPRYLADLRRPEQPADLMDHLCIGLNEAGAR